jgi:prepilin-type N-terminal cleavage/methylation domain-containing protein
MNKNKMNFFGFSLIELMVVIVIIGILASIAIPSYATYTRKSRAVEAEANVNSIAQYQEQYYSENNVYLTTDPNPSSVPSPVDPGAALAFNSNSSTWLELGNIFTNNTQVRFQYRSYAGQFSSNGSDASGYGWATNFNLNNGTSSSGGYACSNLTSRTAQGFGITQTAYANWFVITAQGNQLISGSSGNVCSLIVKVNDRPAVYKESETE